MPKLLDNGFNLRKLDTDNFDLVHPTRGAMHFKRSPQDGLYYMLAKRVTTSEETALPTTGRPPDPSTPSDELTMANSGTKRLDYMAAHALLAHADKRNVEAAARKYGWTLTGEWKPCGACAYAKAKAKAVPKTTLTRVTEPGERTFVDISGPYDPSIKGSRYWLNIVDDKTRMTW